MNNLSDILEKAGNLNLKVELLSSDEVWKIVNKLPDKAINISNSTPTYILISIILSLSVISLLWLIKYNNSITHDKVSNSTGSNQTLSNSIIPNKNAGEYYINNTQLKSEQNTKSVAIRKSNNYAKFIIEKDKQLVMTVKEQLNINDEHNVDLYLKPNNKITLMSPSIHSHSDFSSISTKLISSNLNITSNSEKDSQKEIELLKTYAKNSLQNIILKPNVLFDIIYPLEQSNYYNNFNNVIQNTVTNQDKLIKYNLNNTQLFCEFGLNPSIYFNQMFLLTSAKYSFNFKNNEQK